MELCYQYDKLVRGESIMMQVNTTKESYGTMLFAEVSTMWNLNTLYCRCLLPIASKHVYYLYLENMTD